MQAGRMEPRLFLEIDKFDKWGQKLFQIPQGNSGGECEFIYNDWRTIYRAFDNFLKTSDSSKGTKYQKD